MLKGDGWSSYLELAGYAKSGLCAAHKPMLMGWCGLKARDHRAYRRRMGHLAVQERKDQGKGWEELRRGWCVGKEGFGGKLLDRVKDKLQGRPRASLSEEAVRQHDETEAEGRVQDALKRLGWSETTLRQTRKACPEKEVMAWILRRTTTVGASWIAGRLCMGHPTSVTNAMTHLRSPSPAHQRLIEILNIED